MYIHTYIHTYIRTWIKSTASCVERSLRVFLARLRLLVVDPVEPRSFSPVEIPKEETLTGRSKGWVLVNTKAFVAVAVNRMVVAKQTKSTTLVNRMVTEQICFLSTFRFTKMG